MPSSKLTFSYLCVAAFIVGLLYAATLPTLAIYLTQHFSGIATERIGIFFLIAAISQIAVSQWYAAISDNKRNRKLGVLAGLVCSAITFFLFGTGSMSWWITLMVVALVYSVSAVTLPQIMAMAREQFQDDNKAALVNSVLRSAIAIAWVIGPPIGIYSQSALGTYRYYIVVGLVYAVIVPLFWLILPHKQTRLSEQRQKTEANVSRFAYALLAFSLLWGINHAYMITMPLSLSARGVDTTLSGYLFGLAALLEIPCMLIGAMLSKRVQLSLLVKVGAVSAIVFYISFYLANSFFEMALAQLFNAVFIGLIAGIGVTWFQEMRKDQPGLMSTLFMNTATAGTVIGSIIISAYPSDFNIASVYVVNAVIGLLATVLLFGGDVWQRRVVVDER